MDKEEDFEKKAREWIFYARKHGWRDEKISGELAKKGYSKRFAKKLSEDFPAHSSWKRYLLLIVISAILLGLFVEIYASLAFSVPVCKTDSCFESLANICRPVSMEKTLARSVYSFNEEGCILVKSAKKINETEPAYMVNLIEGDNMTCPYTSGKFDSNLIDTLSVGTDNCTGELKDAFDTIKDYF